jgi:ABC-type multidrug transport system fused ATPase/permease subunit
MSHDEIALEEEFARVPLKRRNLHRLMGYLGPQKGPLIWALILEIVWVASMLLEVRLMRIAVDGPLADGDLHGMWVVAGWLAANILFRVFLTIYELRITTRAGIEVIHAIRKDVFDHVQRLSMRYFDRTKQGRIIARADRDVDTLEHLVMWGPIVVVSLGFSMILGFAMIVVQNAPLALWFIPAIPVVFATSRLFQKLGFPPYRRQREAQSAISSHVAETITGVRVVKAFCAEQRELSRLEKMQVTYRQAVLAGAKIAGAYVPSLSFTFHAVLIVIFVVGGRQVVAGELQIGQLLEFVFLLGFVLGPVEGLGGLYNESLVAGAAAERIFLLLDTEPEVVDRPHAVDPGRLRGEVAFENVSFSYDPSGEAGRQLHEVSFHAPAGGTVALVGPTGAGKSSIANLVARFYEAQEGVVRIDGHDVRDLKVAALHRQMGIVLQESFLFAGSVLENLRFVKEDLTEEEAREAFAELGCEEVLARLPEGLATDVGERGANLSEGERQIVCFVRALAGDPSILILDEATSAVDTRTEILILRALHRLAHHQTTFVIAHRLSTIRDADLILVVGAGRIVEQGTHEQLLEKDGAYAELYAEYAR